MLKSLRDKIYNLFSTKHFEYIFEYLFHRKIALTWYTFTKGARGKMGQLNCLARYKRNIIYRLVSYVSHRSNQTYHVSYIIDDSPVPSNINRLVSSTINYVLCLCVSLSVCRWPPLFSSSTCISYIVMRAHVS